jgi:hypothetical protein
MDMIGVVANPTSSERDEKAKFRKIGTSLPGNSVQGKVTLYQTPTTANVAGDRVL